MTIPDHNADHYIQHSSLQNSHAQEILSGLKIAPGAEVLDVGCGDGRITAELAKKAIDSHVLGIDISRSMIEFASRNFSNGHLKFQLAPIEQVTLSTFNLITSFSCFHWLKKTQDIMKKLIGSLKENGELLILTYPKESPYYQYLETALEKYPEYKHLSSNHTMLSAQEYRDFFQKNGLKILMFEEKTMFASYKDSEEIFNFIKGWVSDYIPLRGDLQEEFIRNVIEEILKDPAIQKDPTICVPYTVLTMKVQKV
jgi:trans-aconitate methyltransferase